MSSDICEVMLEAYNRGWISTRDGNCSFRLGGMDEITITPSGLKKNRLAPGDLIDITIYNSSLVLGDSAPSGELSMHWNLLSSAKSDRCVLHLHPTYIIAAMMTGAELSSIAELFPEVSRYTRVGENVPALQATSSELASATYRNLSSHLRPGEVAFDIVGQKFHGACAVGGSVYEAFEHMERLEHVCKIYLASGINLNGI